MTMMMTMMMVMMMVMMLVSLFDCFPGLLCHWPLLGVALCHPWGAGAQHYHHPCHHGHHVSNQVILEMVDFYAGTLLILALASIEIMAMNWIYGTGTIARHHSIDLSHVENIKLSRY